MKYDEHAEKTELCSAYALNTNSEDINKVIEYFISNVNALINAANKNTFYGYLNQLLTVTANDEERKFDRMCSKLLEHGQEQHLAHEALEIQQILINIRSLINGNIALVIPGIEHQFTKELEVGEQPFQEIVNNIVNVHFQKILLSIEQERSIAIGKLLHQKIIEDKKSGRFKLEEQEGYKLFKKLISQPPKS